MRLAWRIGSLSRPAYRRLPSRPQRCLPVSALSLAPLSHAFRSIGCLCAICGGDESFLHRNLRLVILPVKHPEKIDSPDNVVWTRPSTRARSLFNPIVPRTFVTCVRIPPVLAVWEDDPSATCRGTSVLLRTCLELPCLVDLPFRFPIILPYIRDVQIEFKKKMEVVGKLALCGKGASCGEKRERERRASKSTH